MPVLRNKASGENMELEAILLKGVYLTLAAKIFHMHKDELKFLIARAGVQPIGIRGRSELYDIYDIARLCVPPQWTDAEWEQILTTRHFPAQLVKDYWNARKARQDYLLSAGELWHTDEVVAALSEAFKTVSVGIKLITDNVERETTLTPEQRNLINELIDSALLGGARHLQEAFEGRIALEKVKRYEDLTGEILDGATQTENTNEL